VFRPGEKVFSPKRGYVRPGKNGSALWTNFAQVRGFLLKREGFSLKLEIFA